MELKAEQMRKPDERGARESPAGEGRCRNATPMQEARQEFEAAIYFWVEYGCSNMEVASEE